MDSTDAGPENISPSGFITAWSPGITPAGAACSAGYLNNLVNTSIFETYVLSSPLDGAWKCQDLEAAILPVFFRYHPDPGCEGCSYSLDYQTMVVAV